MDRFIFVDKPLHISSFDVIRKLRRIVNTKKMWHTGTLDPLASGCLLVAVWNYTKLIPYFEKDTKEYEFEISLDWVSDSFDLWTEVEFVSKDVFERYKKELSLEKIQEVLKQKFTWTIKQIPPKYSALKIAWKKAVDRLRAWEDFELASREVEVFFIDILSYRYPKLTLRAKVSSGTYIRSIASDLWNILGTWWYITSLRRTKVGNISLQQATTLEQIDENTELSVVDIFWKWNFIQLEKEILEKINQWIVVHWDFDFEIWKDLFVYDGSRITNIVFYDGKKLKAKRKIV